MVKRVDQAGPGGPVDMTQAKDAILGSTPLETKRDGTTPPTPDVTAVRQADWGEDVKPVADIPLGSPPPEASLPAHEPEGMVPIPDHTDHVHLPEGGDGMGPVIDSTITLAAILTAHNVDLNPRLLGELLRWKHGF